MADTTFVPRVTKILATWLQDVNDLIYRFAQGETGATTRTALAKLQERVTAEDFGAVGDGVTDDTAALTAFFNSAVARPGVKHILAAKTYGISGELPTINVSSVWVEGAETGIHDVSSLLTGTVIKWIGSASSIGIMQQISSVSGAGNQKIKGIIFRGIAYDCDSLVGYGLKISSIGVSDIDVAVANATVQGLTLGVVASLGEARDMQNNNIHFLGRQIEAAGGIALKLEGDATANVSLNNFWVDVQHSDEVAIDQDSGDNNDWWFIRAYQPSGSATDSIAWRGGDTDPERVHYERVHYLTATLPAHAYGTGSYTFAAINVRIFCLDKANGTPDPTVDTGASVYWNDDDSPFGDTPWVSYTPTVAASSGTITTASAVGSYLKRGKIVDVRIEVTITTNGTGSGNLEVSAPIEAGGTIGTMFLGVERASTGYAVTGFLDGASSTIVCKLYDGTYPGSDGYIIILSGSYEIA